MSHRSFPIRDVLAAAIYAFELNGNTVVRTAVWDPTTVGVMIKIPNRMIIAQCLTKSENCDIPSDVTDHHRASANQLFDYFGHSALMQTLSKGKIDDFFATVNNLVQHETIKLRELGIIAWAPKLMADYQKRDSAREIIAMHERTSKYVGKLGEVIEIDFTCIETKPVPNRRCHTVFGHDEHGNFIFYWANSEQKIVKNGKIRGRVKQHKQDPYHNRALLTILNFVKVI